MIGIGMMVLTAAAVMAVPVLADAVHLAIYPKVSGTAKINWFAIRYYGHLVITTDVGRRLWIEWPYSWTSPNLKRRFG